MIEIIITDEQKERARNLYPFDNLNGSITGGKSNMFGAIGEIIVFDYFKSDRAVEFKSTYDYDIIIDSYTVDVKTKKTTVKPQPFYLCSISAFNTNQNCDYYFFVRVKQNLSIGYLLGYINKSIFFTKAIFKKKGDIDINGFTFKDDCYNLSISELNKFKPIK